MKTNICTILLVTHIFMFLCLACERDKLHKDLFIKNNSNIEIYYQPDFVSFPDSSLLGIDSIFLLNPRSYKIQSNSKKRVSIGAEAVWEGLYAGTPSDTIMFFIFDAQLLEKTPWDTICDRYLILKRYDLSFQDLENLNWIILYP